MAKEAKRPAAIYLIEERRGPSKQGPWSDWGEQPPGRLLGRETVSARELTAEECRPQCMMIGGSQGEVWRELSYPDCPPLGSDAAELTAFVLHLGLIAGCIRDGHAQACAERLVWFDASECVCGAEFLLRRKQSKGPPLMPIIDTIEGWGIKDDGPGYYATDPQDRVSVWVDGAFLHQEAHLGTGQCDIPLLVIERLKEMGAEPMATAECLEPNGDTHERAKRQQQERGSK
jgi:hypothetical protein